jgi:hypothetical protein
MSGYKIEYSNGEKHNVSTLGEAHEILSNKYPEVCYCDNGESVSLPYGREIENAGRILVWASEDDSENDGGQKAVAVIVEVA